MNGLIYEKYQKIIMCITNDQKMIEFERCLKELKQNEDRPCIQYIGFLHDKAKKLDDGLIELEV